MLFSFSAFSLRIYLLNAEQWSLLFMENIYEQWRRDETLVPQKSTGHSINSNIFQSVLNASGFSGAKLCTFQYKCRKKYVSLWAQINLCMAIWLCELTDGRRGSILLRVEEMCLREVPLVSGCPWSLSPGKILPSLWTRLIQSMIGWKLAAL